MRHHQRRPLTVSYMLRESVAWHCAGVCGCCSLVSNTPRPIHLSMHHDEKHNAMRVIKRPDDERIMCLQRTNPAQTTPHNSTRHRECEIHRQTFAVRRECSLFRNADEDEARGRDSIWLVAWGGGGCGLSSVATMMVVKCSKYKMKE